MSSCFLFPFKLYYISSNLISYYLIQTQLEIVNIQTYKQRMQHSQTCAICQKQPEDLLILICGHNLCVNCASEIYSLNGHNNPFACEICLMETELDQETIEHFRSTTARTYLKKQKKQPPKQSSNSKPPKSQKKPKQEVEKNFCKFHNQPALYYCYNCNAIDICSQCILTPKHSNHKVVTIKKAFVNLQKKIQQQVKSYQIIRSQLHQQKQFLALKKDQLKNSYLSKRQEIKQIFDQIARQVSQKYAQQCSRIQQQCSKSQQIFNAYIHQIGEKQNLLQDTIKFQKKAHLSQNQTILLQYMSDMVSNKRDMFFCSLPKQLPTCSIQFNNIESICYEIGALLSKFGVGRGEQADDVTDYSYIGQGPTDQPIRTALKQSYKGVNRTNNRIGGSSRKLDMSRSIQNATYIINRLHQRSKNV